jgi:hypothetical protein
LLVSRYLIPGDDIMKLTLSKPIKVQGKEVSELELREPTGDDLITCGVPMKTEITAAKTQLQHVDTAAVAAYISALGNIPPSSVKQMAPRDILKAVEFITSFLGDETPEKPSIDTTS